MEVAGVIRTLAGESHVYLADTHLNHLAKATIEYRGWLILYSMYLNSTTSSTDYPLSHSL